MPKGTSKTVLQVDSRKAEYSKKKKHCHVCCTNLDNGDIFTVKIDTLGEKNQWLGRHLLFEVTASFLWKTGKGTPTRKEDAREIKRLFLSLTPGRWSFWREVTEGPKRTGISWHLSVVYRRRQEELQWQTYIHTAEHPCTRGSSALHPCSASVFFFFSKDIRLREISLQSSNKVYNPLRYIYWWI